MRETTVALVVDGADDRFLRHHLTPAPDLRAWVHGAAVAAEQPGRDTEDTSLWVVGPVGDVAPLLHAVAVDRPRPSRVLVDAEAAADLPAGWSPTTTRTWHWMWTTRQPSAPRHLVEEVGSHDEVRDFLALAYPGSFARPGDPDVECWLGVRHPDAASGSDGAALAAPLAAVGALVRRHDGTGYVRAVSVLPAYRGRGLARDVSAALTRRALDVGTGVATLGVFVDNEPALAVYRRLGYVVAHTFCSSTLA